MDAQNPASVYGCDQEAEDAYDCRMRKYRCENSEFTVGKECESAEDELAQGDLEVLDLRGARPKSCRCHQ